MKSTRTIVSIFISLLILPLITMSIAVTFQVARSLDGNTRQIKSAMELKADANQLLPLLLLQDDATMAILINPEELANHSAQKIKAYDDFQSLLAKLMTTVAVDKARSLIDELKRLDSEHLRPTDTEILELLARDQDGSRNLYFSKYYPHRRAYEKLVRELVDVLTNEVNKLVETLQDENTTLTKKTAATTGFGTFGLMISVIYLVRTIRQHSMFLEGEVSRRTGELREANERLKHEMSLKEEAFCLAEASRVSMTASAKMAALGEMAGGIAHEINNPLGIICFRASQLRRILSSDAPTLATASEITAVIERTGERIAKIISGLRSFCRQTESDPSETAVLSEIVQDTLSLCIEKLKSRGVTVEVDVPQPSPAIVCRSTEVSQCLLNLISNAADAVEKCDDRWIKISISESDSAVVLAISNGGPVIAPEIRERLFQPFFTTKEIGKGTGLGLSISKGLVEDHGGSLQLDASAIHTTFVARLPRRAPSLG